MNSSQTLKHASTQTHVHTHAYTRAHSSHSFLGGHPFAEGSLSDTHTAATRAALRWGDSGRGVLRTRLIQNAFKKRQKSIGISRRVTQLSVTGFLPKTSTRNPFPCTRLSLGG